MPGGLRVVYTDASRPHLSRAASTRLRTDRDLTEERLRKLNAIKFESLPLDQAVKIQRGNGKRVMAMFSDPYCPACQQFEQTLQQIDDITVYVFMFPVIRPQNADHSQGSVVLAGPREGLARPRRCAASCRAAAASCANPVDKNLRARPHAGREQHADADPRATASASPAACAAADLRDVLRRGSR